MALSSLLASLALITPYDIVGATKTRIGKTTGDGAYMMLDRFHPGQIVQSFGIGQNVTFDLDFASRGHKVFMYDHTIEGLRTKHENFHFSREGLAGTSAPDQKLWSLADHLERRGHTGNNMLLKFDVEGYEWPILDETPSDVLAKFEQIVFEAHGLNRIGHGEAGQRMARGFARLNETHTLFHVHPNNYRPTVLVDGIPVHPMMEFSYVRTDLVKRTANQTFYPTAMDRPNSNVKPDAPLFFFPFLPRTGAPDEDLRLLQSALTEYGGRVDAQMREAEALEKKRAKVALEREQKAAAEAAKAESVAAAAEAPKAAPVAEAPKAAPVVTAPVAPVKTPAKV